MKMTNAFINFLRDRQGASAAEFALLSLVFAGILIGIIDLNRLAYENNKIEKACQVGVRFAVENYMVAPNLATFDCTGVGLLPGDSIPVASISPNPVICDDSGCSGAWGHNPAAYNAILAEMSAISSELVNDPAVTIGVTYEHIGMGFCGNPFGTDIWPLTTVTITGRQFDFATPLINPVFGALTLECSASLTGEDFETCPDGVAVPPCS